MKRKEKLSFYGLRFLPLERCSLFLLYDQDKSIISHFLATNMDCPDVVHTNSRCTLIPLEIYQLRQTLVGIISIDVLQHLLIEGNSSKQTNPFFRMRACLFICRCLSKGETEKMSDYYNYDKRKF